MSDTFYLTCPTTNQKLWVGQSGPGGMSLYTGEPEVMRTLNEFMNDTMGMPLVLRINNGVDGDELLDYSVYEPSPLDLSCPSVDPRLRCAPLKIDSYRDGGTMHIERDGRTYYVDFRCGDRHQATKGRWTFTKPWDDEQGVEPVLVSDDEIKSVQETIKHGYASHRMALIRCVPSFNPLTHVLSAPKDTVLTWLPPMKLADLPAPAPGLIAPVLEDDGSSAFAFFIVSAGCSSFCRGVSTYSRYQWFRHNIYT